jgi:hypothetical protein
MRDVGSELGLELARWCPRLLQDVMEQPSGNDLIWLAVVVEQPSDFDRMNDERRTVDLPVLAGMTRRGEAEGCLGHFPNKAPDPLAVEIRYRCTPLLEGTVPASVWLFCHE